MIIDDVGIHHGDWPLISINADQDIKNSNWRDKNDVDVRVCMFTSVCAGMLILGGDNCHHGGLVS